MMIIVLAEIEELGDPDQPLKLVRVERRCVEEVTFHHHHHHVGHDDSDDSDDDDNYIDDDHDDSGGGRGFDDHWYKDDNENEILEIMMENIKERNIGS